MKVTVLRAFRNYSVGDVIPECPGGQARDWIMRGLVKQTEDPPVNGTNLKAILTAPVDRMMRKEKLTLRTK